MKCEICGKEIERSRYGGGKVICSEECFHQSFWSDIVNDPRTIVIGGRAYTAEKVTPYTVEKGFGGDRVTIKFFNGTEVITDNLWYRGEIPEDFREQLPDTAEFVKKTINK